MPDLPEPRLFLLRLIADRHRLRGSLRDLEREDTGRFEAGEELLRLLRQAQTEPASNPEDPP